MCALPARDKLTHFAPAPRIQVQLHLPVTHLLRLQAIFESYCSRGEATTNITHLNQSAFVTFCRDCKLLQNLSCHTSHAHQLTSATLDLLYIQKVKESGEPGMNYDILLETLVAMSQLRHVADSTESLRDALVHMVENNIFPNGTKVGEAHSTTIVTTITTMTTTAYN
jgi:hypothetical protein